jgi:uncharacterized protein
MRILSIFACSLIVMLMCAPGPATSGDPDHELIAACQWGEVARAKKALEAGANINAPGAGNTTPVMWASERGFPEVVGVLIAAGANVNAQNDDGLSALMLAARSNRVEVVKVLLAANSDRDLKDKLGNTAAKWATALNHKAVLELLEK